MIDVIIPCFNAHKTLNKPLGSIAMQTIKDKINVLLVDDCSKETYESFVDKYKDKINISILRLKKNSGPGLAREEGIKHTKGKYITFIDSDDYFMEPTSIEDMYNYIERGFDLIKSVEYHQKRRGKYLLNGNVHGKLYRREYLEKNDIHFNATRFHEDNYFNTLVLISGAKSLSIANCTYFYTYNKKSITNADPKEVDRLEMFLNNYQDLYNIAKKRHYPKERVWIIFRQKYNYLRKIYLRKKQYQKEIKRIVNKYDPKAASLLDLNYYYFIKNKNLIINEFLSKKTY